MFNLIYTLLESILRQLHSTLVGQNTICESQILHVVVKRWDVSCDLECKKRIQEIILYDVID